MTSIATRTTSDVDTATPDQRRAHTRAIRDSTHVPPNRPIAMAQQNTAYPSAPGPPAVRAHRPDVDRAIVSPARHLGIARTTSLGAVAGVIA